MSFFPRILFCNQKTRARMQWAQVGPGIKGVITEGMQLMEEGTDEVY